eukprot:514761-Prorocentrum_minimum.AAC.1
MLWEPSVIQVQHAMIAAINTTHACRMIKGEGVNIKGAKIPDYYRDGDLSTSQAKKNGTYWWSCD